MNLNVIRILVFNIGDEDIICGNSKSLVNARGKFFCVVSHHRTLTSRRHRRTSRLALDSAHNAPTFYKSSRKILFLVDASCCILIRAMPNELKWLSAFSFSFFCLYSFFFYLVGQIFESKIYTSQRSYWKFAHAKNWQIHGRPKKGRPIDSVVLR